MNKHINHKKFLPKIVSRRMQMTGNDFHKAAYMADIMNLANCATPDSLFNTGIPLCDIAKGRIRGVIYLDKGVYFSPAHMASVATFIAELKTKTTAARGSRAYPIFDLLNFEDNTGDPATGSTGNLTSATIVTQEAVPSFRFGYNGTEARHKRMALMNGAALDVMFVDDKYTVYGTQDGVNFKGFSVLQPYTDVSKFIVSDSVNQYAFRITLGDISQYRENSAYVSTNSGLFAAQGLINVQLVELSNASNVYKIQAIADGGTNLEPLYGAAIAGLTWTAKKNSDGTSFTITSVADDTTLDAFTVTFDSTMFTALASGASITLYGPTSAALAGASVKPFEMISVVITKA